MIDFLVCPEKLVVRRHRCELAIEVAQSVIDNTTDDVVVQATAEEITNLRNPLSEGKFCSSSRIAGFAVRKEISERYGISETDRRLFDGTDLALGAIKIGVELARTASRSDTSESLLNEFNLALSLE